MRFQLFNYKTIFLVKSGSTGVIAEVQDQHYRLMTYIFDVLLIVDFKFFL